MLSQLITLPTSPTSSESQSTILTLSGCTAPSPHIAKQAWSASSIHRKLFASPPFLLSPSFLPFRPSPHLQLPCYPLYSFPIQIHPRLTNSPRNDPNQTLDLYRTAASKVSKTIAPPNVQGGVIGAAVANPSTTAAAKPSGAESSIGGIPWLIVLGTGVAAWGVAFVMV